MKIALFTDSFLPGVGGTERAVLGLANAYLKLGEEVAVFCPDFNRHDDSEFAFPVFRCKSIKLSPNDVCAFPSLSGKFKKKLKDFNPDIIHCHTVSPMAAYALKYANNSKNKHLPSPRRVIMTVHTKFKTAWECSVPSKAIVRAMVKDLRKKLYKADKVCVVSRDMIAELNSYGYDGEAAVIRNGAMFDKVDDIEKEKRLATEKYDLQNAENVLLFVGRIFRYKNLQFIFDALKLVKEKVPNFKILLTGKGDDEEYFKSYAEKLGLSANTIFTGEITDKALLSSIYSVGELFVFPSLFDNDPLTVVEAASRRVPAITIKNTGSSERITDGVNGFIAENNVEAFADKIVYLLNHKDELKQAGINAEKSIPKDWTQTAQEYLEIYKQVLQNKK